MSQNAQSRPSESQVFLVAVCGTAAIGLAAYGLSLVFDTPLGPLIKWSANGVAWGLAAVLPLAVFLWWFVRSDHPTVAKFRRSQIEFFADIGFEFTPSRILVMGIAAGVAEELMFRGFLQTWMSGFAPLAVAIVAPNLLFGVLHMRTVLYAMIAGLVGVYLGVLYAITDNLLAPMIAHGVYDVVALEYTRRAIRTHRRTVQGPTDSNTGI